jgi:hypothetical protein
MSCSRVEPIPTDYHIPGNILYSPGFTECYEILSYPLCRLYIDENPEAKFKFQPYAFEYRPNKKAGEGNYLSYLARSLSAKNSQPIYITDHCLKRPYKAKEQGKDNVIDLGHVETVKQPLAA